MKTFFNIIVFLHEEYKTSAVLAFLPFPICVLRPMSMEKRSSSIYSAKIELDENKIILFADDTAVFKVMITRI